MWRGVLSEAFALARSRQLVGPSDDESCALASLQPRAQCGLEFVVSHGFSPRAIANTSSRVSDVKTETPCARAASRSSGDELGLP